MSTILPIPTGRRRAVSITLLSIIMVVNVFQFKWDTFIVSKLSIQPKTRMIRTAKQKVPRCVDSVWTASSRKRDVNMTYANRDQFKTCQFTTVEDGGPIPVIFIVNGRSGSDATWATLSTLAGGRSPIGEHTGENRVKAMDFLGRMTEEEGSWWVTEHLCQFAHVHCEKPLVAFKWKPFVDSWDLPAARGMLKKLALFDEPKIKVILMSRNPLDVLISKIKHTKSGHTIQAHCAPDDQACLELHANSGRGLELPTKDLLKDLKKATDSFQAFASTLKGMNIHHVSTTYEDLYARDDAEEWMNIFKFLGRGPTENLTMTDVIDSFTMAPTAAKHHNESLANYDEIADILVDTEFKGLLH
jgi:hypothetical protein